MRAVGETIICHGETVGFELRFRLGGDTMPPNATDPD